ncbi:MAG: family NAD(P)-dependent oxidoreductase [Hydrocarboniphaga sp.]|uniref:SDR family NAD(P)-dependent oxidoreductase n=1 Tax=Hydrocarboniphaga sp. TaxID=2033016 RepID=UPI00262AABE3|nr:SDR family oxidoreductase [Hydrocarboniphaga sp.]MDB5971381.1 family NAD(P)-dependent oxidoreductase [Hydrocarboniphaga sp.]
MTISLTYPKGGALVTGGTGNVGEGVVRRLAAAGVPLVFTYRGGKERALALESELRDAGHAVTAQTMDMTDAASIQAAVEKVISEYGRLHTVACGAGVPVIFNRLSDFTIEEVEKFMWGDALGYYRVFHTAIPALKAGGGGSITTCSTIALRRHIAFDGISPLSKGSVEALVRQIAAEEREHGIRCNAVGIGWVHAFSAEQFRDWIPRENPPDPQTQEERMTVLLNQLMTMVPRPATPTEAGNLFSYLASDQATYITGQTILLDGGATL